MDRFLVTLLAGALVFGGCDAQDAVRTESSPPATTVSEPSAPGDGDADTRGEMAGFDGDWVATRGAVAGESVELIPGKPITLSVRGTHVDGVAACNGFGAELDFGRGEVSVSVTHVNDEGCDPADVVALQDLFIERFRTTWRWQIDGDTLTISNNADTWTFEAHETPPIAGVTWVLESVDVGDRAVAVPDAFEATLLFGDNDVYLAQTSCGTFNGLWGVGLGAISLAPQLDSHTPCSAVEADLHELLVVAFWGPIEADVDDGRLVVRTRQTTITFRRGKGGPSSPPSIPVFTVSPVRHGGGDPAGQVIGPVMVARQCEDDCPHEESPIAGTLLVDDDCLYLDHPELGAFTPLWPFGTQWQPEPPAVVLPNGSVVEVGDQFDGGGGYHTLDGLAPFTERDEVLERAATCLLSDTPQVAVVQGY